MAQSISRMDDCPDAEATRDGQPPRDRVQEINIRKNRTVWPLVIHGATKRATPTKLSVVLNPLQAWFEKLDEEENIAEDVPLMATAYIAGIKAQPAGVSPAIAT